MKRVAVCGAGGRMGRSLIQAIQHETGITLGAALEYPGSLLLGQDAGELAGVGRLGVPVLGDLSSVLPGIDLVVDFSLPEPTLQHARLSAAQGKPMVIGTTGFTSEQFRELGALSEQIPMVISGNYSVGITICLDLIERATRAFGQSVDIEIMEAHHRHKVDAPSGTALMLGEAVALAQGRDLTTALVHGRQGHTGERPQGQIGMHSLRGGDVVGDHQVWFMGEGERLEIRHVASSRMNFAQGALRAALWVGDQPPGHYTMRQVLGLTL